MKFRNKFNRYCKQPFINVSINYTDGCGMVALDYGNSPPFFAEGVQTVGGLLGGYLGYCGRDHGGTCRKCENTTHVGVGWHLSAIIEAGHG